MGHKVPINQLDSDRPNAFWLRHLHAIRGRSVTVGDEMLDPFVRVLSSEFTQLALKLQFAEDMGANLNERIEVLRSF